MKRGFLVVLGVLTTVGFGLPVVPAAGAAPARDCAGLRADFPLPGAVTHVTSAERVAGAPGYCDVRGFVEPAVHFQLKLPDTWSGRYLQYGCGGRCGQIEEPLFPACGGGPVGDMAVAATDDGHVARGEFPLNFLDGTWAERDQAARDDFFFRAPHVLSRAAKRIIERYYGAPPRHSYFNGCSNGGREAMILAQRYPHDFDGIIAGSPNYAMGSQWGVHDAWVARSNTDAGGRAIITSAKLPALHEAVVAACDGLDGLIDGQLDDPRRCRYDPANLRCPPGVDEPGCLTPAQVDAATKLYDGPRDAQGRRLHPGWETRGSELAWDAWITDFPGPNHPLSWLAADQWLRYVGYPIGTPHSSVTEFPFTVAEFHRLNREAVRGNAMSLDLRRFREAGGRLIIWHGWADQSVPAPTSLDYYQRLWQRNGGLRQTQEWARLFMIPTLYHCGVGGGYRLTTVDLFPELVTWVERGAAPDRVIVSGTNAAGGARTRPVFPHPLVARYDGTGSIDDAANFVPERPAGPVRDTVDWVGTYLHDIPGPVAR